MAALLAIILCAAHASAQQAPQTAKTVIAGNYTYKIFQAPNKMYGYDILQNGKVIFHQFAALQPADKPNTAFAKKEHAEKAALLSVEKLRTGEAASLTNEEIKKITAN